MKTNVTYPHGYRWLCISDETGCFLGRVFRLEDIRITSPAENWAEGMKFRHLHKPIMATVRSGKLIQYPLQQAGD